MLTSHIKTNEERTHKNTYNCTKFYILAFYLDLRHTQTFDWLHIVLCSVRVIICTALTEWAMISRFAGCALKTSYIHHVVFSLSACLWVYSLTKILQLFLCSLKSFMLSFVGDFSIYFWANANARSVPLRTCFLIGIVCVVGAKKGSNIRITVYCGSWCRRVVRAQRIHWCLNKKEKCLRIFEMLWMRCMGLSEHSKAVVWYFTLSSERSIASNKPKIINTKDSKVYKDFYLQPFIWKWKLCTFFNRSVSSAALFTTFLSTHFEV